MSNVSFIVPPVKTNVVIPGLLPTLITYSCGDDEYPPLYCTSQPVPCTICVISISISKLHRIVGVTVGVGVGEGSKDVVGVMVGVAVGVTVCVGLGV